ncbi:hypothetical protein V6N13_147525 [Hibiscus sabdariffa]
MQWKRHEEVVDVYIARKQSRGGKRFEFVRMSGKEDADRVIERLHGFNLYGSNLTVKLARNNNNNGEDMGEGKTYNGSCGGGRFMEDEEMFGGGDSVSSINNRLLNWGMGEIKVQRIGAKSFLLTIEYEDLYLMLEDLEWSYVMVKDKDSRIVGVLGVNANHSRDCEKVTVLISTDQDNKIEEVVEIEVGDKIFEIGVVELGFLDDTTTALGKKVIADKVKCDVIQESESETDTISLQDKKEIVDDDRSCSSTEKEALNVMCAEKDLINCLNREMESLRDQINEKELMGGGNSKVEKKTAKCVNNEEADIQRDCKLVHDENVVDDSIWVGAVSKGLLNDNGLVEHVVDPNEISNQLCEPLSRMADTDNRDMGFKYTTHN